MKRTFAIAVASALILAPGAALAQTADGGVAMIGWFLIVALTVTTGVLLGLLVVTLRRLAAARRERRETDVTRRMIHDALLAGRAGTFTWHADDEQGVASPGLAAVLGVTRSGGVRFGDLLEAIHPNSARSLETAIARLRENGRGFVLTLIARDGKRYFQAVGKRGGTTADFADLLWLQDITDRATPLAQLKRESVRLRGMIDALPFPVWVRNHQQKIIDVNRAYLEAVEVERREDIIKEQREIVEAALVPTARAIARGAVEQGKRQSESHHVVVRGSRRLYEIAELPIGDGTFSAGYAVDVTRVDEVQAELEKMLAANAEVLEHLATAIIVFGPDSRVQYYNSAFTHMWQVDAAWLDQGPALTELLDRLKERRMLPETADFAAFKREWQSWVSSLIEQRQEMMHLPNETTIWMVATPHPLGGLMLTFEDVTDKLTLERDFNTLIDVQRASLDNLYEGVAVFGEDGTLRLSNPTFQNLWGFSDEFINTRPHVAEMIVAARPYMDLGGDWERTRTALAARVTGRMMRSGRLVRSDGVVLAYGIVPMPDGSVLTSFRDVTDTLRVARALRERNEALEAADRLKSEFVANMSYELRTPLNTIIGFTEILHNQYFGALNDRQTEYVEGTLKASRELLGLINDILDLAVIEAGRLVLEVKTVDVAVLIGDLAKLTGEWARARGLTIKVECPEDIGRIRADGRRLKQALFNLLSNAIRFTSDGGEIVVGASRHDGTLTLFVEDTGVGIAAEDRGRVFRPFVRIGHPTQGRSGVGLGLSLVRSIVELHSGTVELEQTPAGGTRVVCRLPASAEHSGRNGNGGDTGESRPRDSLAPAAVTTGQHRS